MLRSVKYGLYTAVLAGLVGGTVAWTNVDKTVTLIVDGQVQHVHTTAATVGAVLASRGYHRGAHDILAPAADATVHDGSKIVYKRGRLLELDVDGSHRSVWTTARTVAEAMDQLGYSATDFTSVSRSRRLPLGPTDIAVRTPKLVTVVHDGKTQHVTTTDATVAQVLDDMNLALGPHDKLSVKRTAEVRQDAKIVLTRVSHSRMTVSSPIPFKTKTTHDKTLRSGTTKVVHAGQDGLARITYAVVYVDGKEVGRTKIKAVVVRVPKPKVVKIGTKQVVRKASVAGAAASGSPKAIAAKLVRARGWSTAQYDCLVTLWNHESHWNVHAANASGAYGIPQAVPGDKMASAGPDWQDSAETQIRWGLGYIADRYGTPCHAWSIWQGQGWY